ncbi:MAG: DMT family transporter [Pseudomonadota bacterium]
MGPRQWLMLLSLSLLWGGSFFFVNVAVAELSPLWTVTLRVVFAALVITAYLLLSGRTMGLTPRLFGAFVIMGFLSNALPFTLIAWGQMSITAGLASMLNAATPIFTMIVAGLLLADERFTLLRVLGALIGAIGVGTMIGPSAMSFGSSALLPQLAVLTATVSYAFGTVYGRRFTAMGLDPVVIALGQLLGSSALLLPVALGVEGPQALYTISLKTALAIGGLGVVSTAIAYLLFFRLLAEAGATNTVLVTLLVPVSATLLGIGLLGETVEPYQLLGITIIALGLSLIDGRLWRRRVSSTA